MASNSAVENSSPIENTLILEEEDFLRCLLQKCDGMLNEVLSISYSQIYVFIV